MQWLKWLSLAALLVSPACAGRRPVSDFDFANRMAREGLWREAAFRYQRALAEGQDTAAVHNNLAIALENLGRWEEADAAYRKALTLRPDDGLIKDNYEQFKKSRGKT